MAAVTPPLFQTIDSVYTGASLGLPYRDWVREGVLGAGDMAVTQRGAGANMSVDVAAGVAWIQGDDSGIQPAYRCYNDATVNLAVAAAHATNPRIDRVIAEVRDAVFSGVSTDWQLRVITGTPAGSPVAPSLPNNAITLALVSVPANDTTIENAQITDGRPRAQLGASGGLVPVVTSLPPLPHDGMVVDYVADSANGVVWRFRYRSGAPSSYKWEFVGGSPLQSRTYNDVSSTNTSYVALSGAPSVTVPLNGEYSVSQGVRQFYSAGGPGNAIIETEVFYGENPCGCEITAHTPAPYLPSSGSACTPSQAMSAGTVVQQRYKSGTGVTSVFGRRTLMVQPVRVG